MVSIIKENSWSQESENTGEAADYWLVMGGKSEEWNGLWVACLSEEGKTREQRTDAQILLQNFLEIMEDVVDDSQKTLCLHGLLHM